MKDSEEFGTNEVRLVGRVSGAPRQRSLPSGDEIVTVRVVVPRVGHQGRQRVDVVDCVAWDGRPRASVLRWRDGDEVELSGSLRRRFYRAGAATVSRTEVEVKRSRRLSRRIGSGNA
jgi:single-strand DNA-binding protein